MRMEGGTGGKLPPFRRADQYNNAERAASAPKRMEVEAQ